MSIVVFFLPQDKKFTHPNAFHFDDHQLTAALKQAEELRKDGCRHVTISSELADSVGKPGVDVVGPDYDWSKQHRGAGPRKES